MTSQDQRRLSREDIDKVLIEYGFLDSEGRQTRSLDRKSVELLIEKNGGPAGLDLVGADLVGANLVGAQLGRRQLSEEQRSAIRGQPAYVDDSSEGRLPLEGEDGALLLEGGGALLLEGGKEDATLAGSGQAEPKPDQQPSGVTRAQKRLPGRSFAANDEFDGVDRLDMTRYARALARLVMNEESQLPLTIGAYGEWGSGKTALMELVRQELEAERQARNLPLLMVRFNAWEHAGDRGRLWAGLARAIAAEMDDRMARRRRFWYGMGRNWGFVWRRLREQALIMTTGAVGIAAIPVAQAWMRLVSSGTSTDSFVAWVTTAVGAVVGLPSLARGANRGLWPALSRPTISRLTTMVEDVGVLDEADPAVARVSEMLRSLGADLPREFSKRGRPVGRWPGGDSEPPTSREPLSPLKTVVFIDDLDRCPPDKIVDVLEGIKLVLKERQFVVFLAVDTRIVSRAIEHRYRHILHTGARRPPGELGMEYLAKIVQIPFLLPRADKEQIVSLIRGRQPPHVRKGVLRAREGSEDIQEVPSPAGEETETQRLGGDGRSRESASIEDAEVELWETVALTDEDSQAIVDLAHPFTQNPRTFNRLGNELRVMRLLLHEEGGNQRWRGARGRELVKWLVLCDQWPAFGPYLAHGRGLAQAGGLSDGNRLAQVGRSPEAMRVLGRRYDPAAIDRLHAFLEQTPALDVEEVRELVPFTTNLTGIYE